MDRRATSIVSYLSFIGWLIAFCAGDREGANFHLNQSLVLNLAGLIVAAIRKFPLIGSPVAWILNIVLFVLWIMGFIYACQDKEQEVPVIGSIHILK